MEASLVHDKDRILTRPKIIVGTLDSRQGSSLNEPCEYLQILIKSLFSAFVTYFTRNSEVHVLCSFNTFNCRTVTLQTCCSGNQLNFCIIKLDVLISCSFSTHGIYTE